MNQPMRGYPDRSGRCSLLLAAGLLMLMAVLFLRPSAAGASTPNLNQLEVGVDSYFLFTLDYEVPADSTANKIRVQVYSLTGDELQFTETYTSYSPGSHQSRRLYTPLSPGAYKLRVTTYNNLVTPDPDNPASPGDIAVTVYDNHGSGYIISPGDRTLQVPVTLWSKSGLQAGIPIEIEVMGGNEGFYSYASFLSSAAEGGAQYSGLPPGYYRIVIPAFAADGIQYGEESQKLRISEEADDLIISSFELSPENLPTQLEFEDTDLEAGYISGEISWEAPQIDEDTIQEYRVYFENAAGAKLDSVPLVAEPVNLDQYGYYWIEVLRAIVPEGAAWLQLYIWDGVNEQRTPAVVKLWDVPVIPDAHLEDDSPASHVISPLAVWPKARAESLFAAYVISRAGQYGSESEIVARIPAANADQYSYGLPQITAAGLTEAYQGYYLGVELEDGTLGPVQVPLLLADRLAIDGALPEPLPNPYSEAGFSYAAPQNVTFLDTDPVDGQIGGLLTWTNEEIYNTPTAFDIYFMDSSNQVVGSLARIFYDRWVFPDAQRPTVSYRIPDHTPVPDGAVTIGIYTRVAEYTSTVPGTVGIQERGGLASLIVTPGTMSPAFSTGTLSYTVTVPSYADAVEVQAAGNQAATALSINGIIASSGVSKTVLLNPTSQVTVIPVDVYSASGQNTEYSITVVKGTPAPVSLELGSLSLSAASVAFDPAQKEYSVAVTGSVYDITVTAAPSDNRAVLNINGTQTGHKTVHLTEGMNVITVTVSSPNEGESGSDTYRIYVYRAFSVDDPVSTDLAGLSVTPGTIHFDKNTLYYSLSVPAGISAVSVTAAVYDLRAEVEMNQQPFISPQALELETGLNLFAITVKDPNNAANYKVYLLSITREDTAQESPVRQAIRAATGSEPGAKIRLDALMQFLNSPSSRQDWNGDEVFNADDLSVILQETDPYFIVPASS
ncbi:cadherin-like beta sandwich domain-containing protein [Paenibacillus sp. y28]|uniref:cadherin-like beta sandwich domain-containing protein n=1 Tax=Paenibacillus sp. y28 TaxID=3129110 RepID=UPI003018F0E7